MLDLHAKKTNSEKSDRTGCKISIRKFYKIFMKVSRIASIPNYMSANFWYCLLLLTTTPVLISSSAFMSTAAPITIAQVNTEAKINRPTLKIDSQGERVTELQAALKLLGFYSGAIDGTYQQSTAIAVSQFQQAAGLTPNGDTDNITWQRLFPSPSNSKFQLFVITFVTLVCLLHV